MSTQEELIKKGLKKANPVQQEWLEAAISYLKDHQDLDSARKEMLSLSENLNLDVLLRSLEQEITASHLFGMLETQEEYDGSKNLGRD